MNDNDDFNPFDTDETELVTADRQPATILSPEDEKAFQAAESKIRVGLKAFVEVGLALVEIRDNRWYRAKGYATFADYCEGEHDFSRQRAYQLMGAATVTQNLEMSNMFDILPSNPRQANELSALPPEQQVHAWKGTLEKAASEGRPVTARDAADAAMDVRPTVFKRASTAESAKAQTQDDLFGGQGSTSSAPQHNFKPETPKLAPLPIIGVRTSWECSLRYCLLTEEGDAKTGVIVVRPAKGNENALPGRYMVELNGTIRNNAHDLAQGIEIAERIAEGLKYGH